MLAMPRQTHPRTVASINPPGTQILTKAQKDCEDDELSAVNEKNVVQQNIHIIDSRSV